MIFAIFIVGCANKNNARADVVAAPASPATETIREEIYSPTEGVDLEIREKMFIAQTNDIYLNRNDYIGKTIKLEGLFKLDHGYERDYCFVLRYGPGCCGYDGTAGFEVSWEVPGQASEGEQKEYPKVNDWVMAQGVLQRYEEYGDGFLYLALSELKVLEKRGAEFVNQ